jgi:D-sedoheptulose 7-phosphate isomerase
MIPTTEKASTEQGTMERAAEAIRSHLLASAQLKKETADSCLQSISAAALVIVQSLRAGGKLLICGNGGSAADSQHLAGEFVNLLNKNEYRPAMAAIALTTDSSVLTAIANDSGFDSIFERQIAALGKPGDVVLAISTSGNSENLLRALRYARREQLRALALTGASGGSLKSIADIAICVPSEDVQRIQETHLAIEHILCTLVEQELFGANRS